MFQKFQVINKKPGQSEASQWNRRTRRSAWSENCAGSAVRRRMAAGGSSNFVGYHGWNDGVSPKTAVPEYEQNLVNLIKVVVPSIKGDITVDLKKTASDYSLALISPASTTAIVGIARRFFTRLNSIKVGATTIWDRAYRGGVAGVSWIGQDADHVKFNVGPGSWNFVRLGTLPTDSPKPVPAPPSKDRPLDKKTWTPNTTGPSTSSTSSPDDERA